MLLTEVMQPQVSYSPLLLMIKKKIVFTYTICMNTNTVCTNMSLHKDCLTPWGPTCIWGPWDVLTCPDICSFFFSVAYKHINGTGEITLYLAQTDQP